MKKPSMKDGVTLALSLGIIMLLAVIIGGSARLYFDKVSERLSNPPTREENFESLLNCIPIQNYTLQQIGGIPVNDSSSIID